MTLTMSPSESPVGWLAGLASTAVNLPQQQPPRPYYSQRESDSAGASEVALSRRVHLLVQEFHDTHYFAEAFGYECFDAYDESESSPERELERRVGKPHLWSNKPEDWTKSDLCDFIEVFHDLAARPTKGWVHQHNGCGWHPEAFSQRSGQAVYRGRMNQLLDKSSFELRLAETGEDTGRMVLRAPDELGRLVNDTLGEHTSTDDPVAHAVALFRHRDGDRQDRRSAILALAGVLEERRELLKDRLRSKDEQVLFEIANRFGIRHQDTDQYQDYGTEYLEWIFYWYLATVHLTDQLLDDSTG